MALHAVIAIKFLAKNSPCKKCPVNFFEDVAIMSTSSSQGLTYTSVSTVKLYLIKLPLSLT